VFGELVDSSIFAKSRLDMMFFLHIIFITLIYATGLDATGNVGVVGLGRTVFEPLCCYACLGSLWGLNLACTVPEKKGESTGSDAKCHASSSVYLNSLAYCLQVNCAADNVSESQVGQCWSVVAGDGLEVSSLEQNLPSTPPTTELAYDAQSLVKISLVNNQFYENSRTTIQGYVAQETVHALYGFVYSIDPRIRRQ
jgi:hypothetical protein